MIRSTFSEFCAWRRDQPLYRQHYRPECRSASHTRLKHTLSTAHLRPFMKGLGEVVVERANSEHRTDERVNAPCPRHLVRVVSTFLFDIKSHAI